jgi:hypothetical protein
LREVKGSERAIELMNKWSEEIRGKAWGKTAGFIKGGDR